MRYLSIAKDFSKKPGFRFKYQSPGVSGEEFRDEVLTPKYLEAVEQSDGLTVVLDGTHGYLTSFLEEAFGGLQAKRTELNRDENILDVITIVSNDELHWVTEIARYIKEARENVLAKK